MGIVKAVRGGLERGDEFDKKKKKL